MKNTTKNTDKQIEKAVTFDPDLHKLMTYGFVFNGNKRKAYALGFNSTMMKDDGTDDLYVPELLDDDGYLNGLYENSVLVAQGMLDNAKAEKRSQKSLSTICNKTIKHLCAEINDTRIINYKRLTIIFAGIMVLSKFRYWKNRKHNYIITIYKTGLIGSDGKELALSRNVVEPILTF